MYINMNDYYKSCDACQRIRGSVSQSLAKLVRSLLKEPFVKWGLDFVGPLKPTCKYTINKYKIQEENLIRRWKMKIVYHINHICKPMKKNNGWKILRSK